MKKILWLLSLVLFLVLLVGCNSNIVISPNITVEGEEIHIIGYIGSNAEPEGDNPPKVYKMIEPTIVSPNAVVTINYIDPPKRVLLKSWYNGELIEDYRKLKEFKIQVPSEEGLYIFNIASDGTLE
ncbi:hypothetical protein BKP35_07075 [Anaerobacillus arseniciselenatis]|uniref:Uncharacterized protein n=1 Tax=Anaerobacillus arseniciselenatis TaxID=85682 RepID=A0A1S2LPF8_9BACI|nr:hypothetical protein [Anaerobacillus arseniciselenatis]OIJ14256.1 hypothetical protein BKP35_07075 [Anaerobacillus arseniciselenatis]